jgi:hypothetical protein
LASSTSCLPIILFLAFSFHPVIFSFFKSFVTSSIHLCLGLPLLLVEYSRGSRLRFQAVTGNFSFHHRVHNGSGAHPASYPMGTRGSFPGGKAAGAWSWPLTSKLLPSSRMHGAIPPLPIRLSDVLSLKKHRGNFTFTLPYLILPLKLCERSYISRLIR